MDFTMTPGVPMTVPLIFTTFGYMHPSQVRLERQVVQDDADRQVIRTDKYTLDGQWCGNDVTVNIKRWPDGMNLIPGRVGA